MEFLEPTLFGGSWSSDNLLLSGDGMAMVGPLIVITGDPDPMVVLWASVAKIINSRSLAATNITAYHAWQSAFIKQMVSSMPGDITNYFHVVVPLVSQTNSLSQTLEGIKATNKNVIDLYFRTAFASLVGLPSSASMPELMEAIFAYMRGHGVTMEDAEGGFRDFLVENYVDTNGDEVDPPTSGAPNVLDSWIASNTTVVSGGGETSAPILLAT